jgi:hypothetical protein
MVLAFDLSQATPLTRIRLMLAIEKEIKLLQEQAAALETRVRELAKK